MCLNHRKMMLLLLSVAGLMAASAAQAQAARPTLAEVEAINRKKAVAEAEARQEIESLFSRLCPGRCELIGVNAITATPKVVGDVTPGFEAEGSAVFETELKRLEAKIMIDSTLPNNFRSNIPAMLQYRLSNITPNVVIIPTVLEFPSPQLPPQPPLMAEPPPKPRPAPEPAQVEEPKPEEPKVEPPKEVEAPKEVEEKPWYKELWAELLPWIPFILMLLVFFALLMRALKAMREMVEGQQNQGAAGADDAIDPQAQLPDLDELRQELKQSRAIQNEVLRGWLQQDPATVATLVRLIGPEVLGDLKKDGTLRPAIEVVSQEVARQTEPVTPTEARRVERELRSRLTAARVLHEQQALSGDWEFVQGLGVANLQRVMGQLKPEEKSYAIGQLPAALRASYMNQMDPAERRELFMSVGSAEAMSREQAIDLAARLRKSSEEVAHIGAEASGQALIIVEMLRALGLAEQTETLKELRQRRPETAQAVLEQVCLESTLLHALPEVVADAMHRSSVEVISQFMRGTRDDIRDHLLRVSPGNLRRPLQEEMALEIPVSRSEYLDARTEFTNMVVTVLRRDGHDLASLNARALTQPLGPSANEANL